jgi:hypothetical protein
MIKPSPFGYANYTPLVEAKQVIFETKSQEKYSPLPIEINFSLLLGIQNNPEI